MNTILKQAGKSGLVRFWKGWIKPIVTVVIVLSAFRSAVADWNDVPTGSMKPTILEGDRVFVNKLAYDLKVPFTTWHVAEWADPQRGDVVICYAPDTGDRLVKRVIGLPGDTVEMRESRLFINDEPAVYQPLELQVSEQIGTSERIRSLFARERLGADSHPVMLTPGVPARRSFGPLTIPADRYFVLGDNRDNSRDSRFFGFVDREQIVGRALGVALSVDPDHHYLPRWDRFFKGLD